MGDHIWEFIRVLRKLVIVGVILWSGAAWAVLDLHVNEPLPVYSKPSKKSKKISRLGRGDTVVISPKRYGRYRKVLVRYKGRRRGGYIPARLIQKSEIIERGSKDPSAIGSRGKNYTVGITYNLSFLYMQGKSFSTSETDVYEISEFKSNTGYLNIFGDIPMAPGRSLRLNLGLRSVEFAGAAELKGVVAPATNYEVGMKRDLMALGVSYRFFSSKASSFWWGVGGEYNIGSTASVSIKANNSGNRVSFEESSPAWITGFFVSGWEIQIFEDYFLVPQYKLGAVLNNDPFIFDLEMQIGAFRRF